MTLLAIERFSIKSKIWKLIFRSAAIIAALIAFLLALWYINVRFEMAACNRVADQLALDAKQELIVGDSAVKVENFLNARSIQFSYDEFQGRYQGNVRNIYKPSFFDGAVSVYIKLDSNGKYLSAEFQPTFTFL